MLEIHQVGAVGLEEATPGEAGLQFLQRQVGGGLFVGPFAQLLGSSPFTQIIKILPPYYIADGASNAVTNANALPATVLDVGVTVGVTLILVLISLWTLRRQAAVVSTI